jgi:uncharacterized protein
MILPDANLLIYAVNTTAPKHTEAKLWVEEMLSGVKGSVGLSWFTLVAFVRIVTNRKALANPFMLDEALNIIRSWVALPNVEIIGPGLAHAGHFESLCRATNASGNLITDAHLAALAIEHDCELASCDTDFAKFPGLRWINPL